MPTEITTPNFGIRVPTAANTGPNFATGVSDMATDIDNLVRLKYRNGVANLSAVSGDWVVASPSVTVTLPAPSANAMVAVTANGSVTGTTPVTVSGTNIYGLGLAGAASFKLGAAVAPVVLQSDGGNWIIVSGQQDTGWLTMPFNAPYSDVATNTAYRVVGDRVLLRGGATRAGSAGISDTLATLPTGARPATIQFYTCSNSGHTTLCGVQVLTDGRIIVSGTAGSISSIIWGSVSFGTTL